MPSIWLPNVGTVSVIEGRFTTVAPGGDGELSFGYYARRPVTPPAIGGPVNLVDAQGVFWMGRVEVVNLDISTVDAKVSVTARGWQSHAADLVFKEETIFPGLSGVFEVGGLSPVTLGEMISYAKDTLCSKYISGNNSYISSTANVLLADNSKDFRGDPAITVWSHAASFGSTNGESLIWVVRPPFSDAGTLPILEVYEQSEADEYTIDMDQTHSVIGKIGLSVQAEWDLQRVRNHIYVTFSDPQVWEAAGVDLFPLAWAIAEPLPDDLEEERDMWIDASSEFPSEDTTGPLALAISTAYKYGNLRSSGVKINVPYPVPVLDGTGPTTVPLWRVRAGRTLTITDFPANSYLYRYENFITETSFDFATNQLSITTGSLSDPRAQRRMAGIKDKRPRASVPPLARPNEPETSQWIRVTINQELQATDGAHGELVADFSHILREIHVISVNGIDSGSIQIQVRIYVEGSFPNSHYYSRTITPDGTQSSLEGLRQVVAKGDRYRFDLSGTATPSTVDQVTVALMVDRRPPAQQT